MPSELPITEPEWSYEYTAESQARQPLRLLGRVASGIWEGRSLARQLFVRNLTSTYRQTLLGFVWILIPTIAQIATWTFLAKQQLLSSDQLPGVPYILFIAVGSLLWQTFFDALQAPLRAVNANQSLITRINFPRESLILVAIWEVLFDFSVRAVMVAAVCLFMGVTWTAATLLVPLCILGLVLVGLAIGLLLTPVGVLYQDVGRSLSVLSPFWMILTPVVYLAPDSPSYQVWNMLNPPAALLSACRDLLIVGQTDMLGVAACWLAVLVPLLIVSLVWYRLGFPFFVERLAN